MWKLSTSETLTSDISVIILDRDPCTWHLITLSVEHGQWLTRFQLHTCNPQVDSLAKIKTNLLSRTHWTNPEKTWVSVGNDPHSIFGGTDQLQSVGFFWLSKLCQYLIVAMENDMVWRANLFKLTHNINIHIWNSTTHNNLNSHNRQFIHIIPTFNITLN